MRVRLELCDNFLKNDMCSTTFNSPVANQDLDTSTPEAMAKMLQSILTTDALKPKSRELLLDWLLTNTTGAKRLKAGLPAKWKIGDKTGTGLNGSTANDVGILYPPNGAPIIVVAFISDSKSATAENEKALADIGRIISAKFSK